MKGCFRGKRQNSLFIEKAFDGENRQKGAEGKRDPQPLRPLRLGHRGHSGQWPLQRDFVVVLLFEKEQMPLTRSRANRGILFPSPTTPDRLDRGRVRSSPFKKSIQNSASNVSDRNDFLLSSSFSYLHCGTALTGFPSSGSGWVRRHMHRFFYIRPFEERTT